MGPLNHVALESPAKKTTGVVLPFLDHPLMKILQWPFLASNAAKNKTDYHFCGFTYAALDQTKGQTLESSCNRFPCK